MKNIIITCLVITGTVLLTSCNPLVTTSCEKASAFGYTSPLTVAG